MTLKFKITTPVLEKELDEINLSNRAMNCLHRLGCKTVEDIIDRQHELMYAKGCGAKTVTEVKNKILELQIIEATKLYA